MCLLYELRRSAFHVDVQRAVPIIYEEVSLDCGYFTVPAVDPGAYTVTVTLMGFKTAVLNDVRVNAATPATVRIALAVGGLEETVVVTGGAEIIQTQSAAVTSTIDANRRSGRIS